MHFLINFPFFFCLFLFLRSPLILVEFCSIAPLFWQPGIGLVDGAHPHPC